MSLMNCHPPLTPPIKGGEHKIDEELALLNLALYSVEEEEQQLPSPGGRD